MTRRQLLAGPMMLIPVLMLLAAVTLAAGAEMADSPRESADVPAPWTEALKAVDDALPFDLGVAVRAWHDAYSAAWRSRRWEGFVAVGDAYPKIGAASKEMAAARATARASYVMALNRATAVGSVDGVLRVARAFDALGDREVALTVVRMAEKIVRRQANPDARTRVQAFAHQLTRGASGPR